MSTPPRPSAPKLPELVDPNDVDVLGWHPTHNQIEAYKEREVTMCIREIALFAKRNPSRKEPLRQDETLYSFRTWDAAWAIIKTQESAQEAA